jgi:hypothetical protein
MPRQHPRRNTRLQLSETNVRPPCCLPKARSRARCFCRNVVANSSSPSLGKLNVVSGCQNAVGWVGSEVPRGQQNRYIRTLGGPRRCKQQQHLVLAFEERFDLSNEELMVWRGLEAFMAGPLARLFRIDLRFRSSAAALAGSVCLCIHRSPVHGNRRQLLIADRARIDLG